MPRQLLHGPKDPPTKPLVNVIARHLGYNPAEVPPGRCVGKSTALALEVIARALQNPGISVQIKDHVATPAAVRITTQYVERYIHDMGLVGFKIHRTPVGSNGGGGVPFLRFDLWVEAE